MNKQIKLMSEEEIVEICRRSEMASEVTLPIEVIQRLAYTARVRGMALKKMDSIECKSCSMNYKGRGCFDTYRGCMEAVMAWAEKEIEKGEG